MNEYEEDSKKRQITMQLRKEAKEFYNSIKHRLANDKSDSQADHEILDAEVDKYIDLEDRDKLREKFRCLATDNCRLREQTICLRYELETIKDVLDETQQSLLATERKERKNRDELAYLKHVSKTQNEEIKSLAEVLKHLHEFIKENGLECPPIELPNSTSPKPTESPLAEEKKKQRSSFIKSSEGASNPSWLQSIQAAFHKVKLDILQIADDTSQNSD